MMTDRNSLSLLGTEHHARTSKFTGKEYEISIALPYTYVKDPIGGGPFYETLPAWPTVYLTDANWHIGMVTEFVREMAWCGRSLDAIVVGIGYPERESAQETWRTASQLRSDDLTPARIPGEETSTGEWLKRPVKTGGGDRFLAFLRQELVPWVEQEYRADPNWRILAGHSYGGLFALYALFMGPQFFRGYIAASPYLVDPEHSIFTLEREYAQHHEDLVAQLYLAAGELEESAEDTTLSDMYRLAGLLTSRKYKGLAITRQVFADNNHCEVAALALHEGLKMVLRK